MLKLYKIKLFINEIIKFRYSCYIIDILAISITINKFQDESFRIILNTILLKYINKQIFLPDVVDDSEELLEQFIPRYTPMFNYKRWKYIYHSLINFNVFRKNLNNDTYNENNDTYNIELYNLLNTNPLSFTISLSYEFYFKYLKVVLSNSLLRENNFIDDFVEYYKDKVRLISN